MKKILALVALAVFIAVPAFAVEYQLTFGWEQATADLPNLAEWRLVMQTEGAADQTVVIPYDGSSGPFESIQNFVIGGNPGDTVTRSFYVVSVSKNSNAAAPSNTVVESFVIPHENVGAATSFEIKVKMLVE